MESREDIRSRLKDKALDRLLSRVVTLEEAELMIEQVLDYLIQNQHMDITGLGFERLPGGCDVEIIYRN